MDSEQPSPHGIAKGTVLYAFEEADMQKKGQYLGEFVRDQRRQTTSKCSLVPTGQAEPARDRQIGEDRNGRGCCTRSCRTTTTRFSPS